MTGEWEDARIQVADARLAPAADHEARAELDVIGAQVALGNARPGSRSRDEELAARAAATAKAAGRPDLTCEALEVLGLAARLRDLDVAHDALARALDVAATANLRVHRLRILNELGTVEMLRDARGDRLEQARREAARSGAVGLAAGIGANIAALMAMTARFDATLAVAAEVEQTAVRLGLIPPQAAALLMQGFALAHQGRSRDMERYLAAAEAAAPDDPDLRAGAWGIGRAISALLAEDRSAARQALARARAEAPDQHARILNPYEGPELLLRVLAGEAGPADVEAAAAGAVRAARWPNLWFGAAQAVALGAAGESTEASAALTSALAAGDRYPVFCALTMRLTAEAALRDGWGAQVRCSVARKPRSPGCGWAVPQPPAGPCSRAPATQLRAGAQPTPSCPPPWSKRASRPARPKCSTCSPTACPTVRSPRDCSSRRAPSRSTSPACWPSSAPKTATFSRTWAVVWAMAWAEPTMGS
jgi:tetratricopeptide (TPR) repeat protein